MMTRRSLHGRLAINDVWVHDVALPGPADSHSAMSWAFGPIQLVETPEGCAIVLAATTVVRLLFDGTLPRDKTTACVLRHGYRVLGAFVLERVENGRYR